MKKMKDLAYHYGLKMRIYPSRQQKEIIKINSDVSRAVYNKLVAIDKELYQLKQVKLPIETVIDRINELEKRKNARNMSNHYQYMQDKRIDSLAKANAIQNFGKTCRRTIKTFDNQIKSPFGNLRTLKALVIIV